MVSSYDSSAPPFQTSLKLTPEQEKRLLHHVVTRLGECCKDMGRDAGGRTQPNSFLDIRRINQLSFEGDYEWRKGATYYGGVFDDSNLSRHDGRRYVRHMAAKVSDDLLGTSPFFACMDRLAQPKEKEELIKSVEEYVQAEVEASPLPYVLREAVELALARNEAVVKLRTVFDATGYVGPARVLVGTDGQPVITPGKELYVLENDDLIPLPDKPGFVALEKDPSFILSDAERAQMRYADFDELPQTQTENEGLDGRVIDPRDFICPLKADSIHEADIVAHYYDETDTKLAETYGGFDVSQVYFNKAESGAHAPIASQGEEAAGSANTTLQWVNVGEVYVRFDADQDGRDEHILLILDRGCEKAVFYDYLSNHMKKRPFEVIHGLRKVPGRWYGVGIFTDKHDQLIFIDKTFNRINLKTSKTASVTAASRDAIEEWDNRQAPIKVGGNVILTKKKNWDATQNGPWLERINLIEVCEEELELMREMIQASDQEFGFISSADASAANLNQSKTATGITNLERSGNNIVKSVERAQMRGITAIMDQATDIILENLDATRLVLTKDANLLTLNRDEIRDLPRDTQLLLTRSKSSDGIATNEAATAAANEFFTILETNPRRAKALRPLYLTKLKFLEIESADELLPEVTDEQVKAWEQQQSQKGAPQRPESLSINYKDAPDPIKRQMEAKAGLQPLTPEQEAVENARAAQSKAQEAALKQPPPTRPPSNKNTIAPAADEPNGNPS